MKAMLSEAPGGPETLILRDIPEPEPGPGEVRIAVRMAGINFADSLIIEDRYQHRPARPFAPGAELVGRIDKVGSELEGFSVGERVMALPMWGAVAEKVCVRASHVHPLPDTVCDETAAALQVVYGTAYYALALRGGLRARETLVVLGAAGGTGLACVEIGRALGARVIAAASSQEKLEIALAHGADAGFVYRRGPLDRDAQKVFAGQIRDQAGPGGADVVADIIGGDYSEPAVRSLGWGGRLMVIGFPAGIARLPLNLTLVKGCDIRGVFWGEWVDRYPAEHHGMMDRLLEMSAGGGIRPAIHAVYPMEETGAAIAALAGRGVTGKVLVRVG